MSSPTFFTSNLLILLLFLFRTAKSTMARLLSWK